MRIERAETTKRAFWHVSPWNAMSGNRVLRRVAYVFCLLVAVVLWAYLTYLTGGLIAWLLNRL
jgi:hypothetical protein